MAWRAYTRLVEKFPWGSQMVQSGLLCATGDLIAQLGIERKRLEQVFINTELRKEYLFPYLTSIFSVGGVG